MYASLADGDNVTYILSDDLHILRTNAAWERFARENGGENVLAMWRRGAALLDAVPAELQRFLADGFARARRSEDRWEHDYECSSPTEHRTYRMIVYPFSGGFVVTHALLVSRPHEQVALEPGAQYEHDGLISMCAHCRRVRWSSKPERWDWVPAYVAKRHDNISHGLCAACYRFYYP